MGLPHDGEAGVAPTSRAIGHVDSFDAVLLKPLAGTGGAATRQANEVNILVQIQLAVSGLQLGKRKVNRALRMPLVVFIHLADVDQLRAGGNVGGLYSLEFTHVAPL